MPRRTRLVTIEKPADGKENRDAGKVFIVTEADAITAEEWGLRAMMALGTGGIQVPPELVKAGLLGVLFIGYQAFMGAKEDAVLPLWREMLPACVALRHSEQHEIVEPFGRHQVEEVSTLLLLRQAIMEIHTGFTVAEIASRLSAATSALQPQNLSTTQGDQSPAA